MPIDFNGLDTAVHGLLRLGILTVLQVDGPLDFTTLKKRLDVSDGAIGQHLLKLEEFGYLTCTKAFVGRRPRTTYRISGCRPQCAGALSRPDAGPDRRGPWVLIARSSCSHRQSGRASATPSGRGQRTKLSVP